jgi:hypothetical protein
MQEIKRRIITRTLDNYVQNYRNSTNDHQRKRTDHHVREFLRALNPEEFQESWDYYEKAKLELS